MLMTEIEYEILDSPERIEISGDIMYVTVDVTELEREFKGTSNDEEYFERHVQGRYTQIVQLPILYIYEKENPDNHLEGQEAKKKLNETEWSEIEAKDVETAVFTKGDEMFIATFDASRLDKYQ